MPTDPYLWLFSYGTLRQPEVQIATFGRRLESFDDALVGYALSTLTITDARVIALSGSSQHPILTYTGDPSEQVLGAALNVTETDLLHADQYEVAAYRRVPTILRSGRHAFVYVAAHQ